MNFNLVQSRIPCLLVCYVPGMAQHVVEGGVNLVLFMKVLVTVWSHLEIVQDRNRMQ